MNERPTPITDANTCLQNKIGALTIEPEICRRLERERDEARETIARLNEWHDLTDDALRLRCGELTEQEIRTVRAVLNAILADETTN